MFWGVSKLTDQTFCGRTHLTFPFISYPLVDSSKGVIHKKWAAATSNLGKSKPGVASTLHRQWTDSCAVWKEALQRRSERAAWCLREYQRKGQCLRPNVVIYIFCLKSDLWPFDILSEFCSFTKCLVVILPKDVFFCLSFIDSRVASWDQLYKNKSICIKLHIYPSIYSSSANYLAKITGGKDKRVRREL